MSGPRVIRRLAIANRGEAALRCIRAVKALRAIEGGSLAAIALYTDVDRDAPFVRHADTAVRIASERGEVAAYLDRDLLLDAVGRADADAVWPGWGFVSEDPEFAARCEQAGIAFLGPSAEAMRAVGDKIRSKRLAEESGVPVTPWSGGELRDVRHAAESAERVGYPVVLKASAGGGGRGIRIAEREGDLEEAFRSAASEARGAFGDDRLFLEAKVSNGRHVEVQIAADAAGCVRVLGCRDCSVQRRHQKVIEEAPPPGIAQPRLDALSEAAAKIAQAVGYQGVGTVEFLVTADAFHFLEVNPRLQVEHGLTEALTGLDLVELQIRIARGESLEGLQFDERGAAIEARICAEDPEEGFLPAPGRIALFDPALGPRVRIDTGVAVGSVMPAAFDSLIAKVIASGRDREEARARLAGALLDFDLVIEGGASNKGFLLEVLESQDFREGGVDTTWLDRYCEAARGERDHAEEALVAAGILSYQKARGTARLNFLADASNISPAGVPPSRGQQIDLSLRGETYRLEVFALGAWRYRVHCDGRVVSATLREEGAHAARLVFGDRVLRVVYDHGEAGLRVEVEGRPHRFSGGDAGHVRAGTPAMVVAVHVSAGDRVKAGQPLGVLEAMKTEIGIHAPVAGVVTEVLARRGQQVAAGDVLLVIDPGSEDRASVSGARRLQLPELADPLAPLFERVGAGALGAPDLLAADATPPSTRQAAVDSARDEVRRVLLGYDANPERAERLAAFLAAPLPEGAPGAGGLSEAFLWQLAEIRGELVALADVNELFIRSPGASVGGQLGPSNNARLRIFVRRLHAGGAGIEPAFLELVKRALAHYGVSSLDPSDALERAVLRLLAAPQQLEAYQHLAIAIVSRVTELAERGVRLSDDRALEQALGRIARMRGLVNDALADAAVDASYTIFQRPRIEALAERTSEQLESWLARAENDPSAPPESVLCHLADAPRQVFDRVGHWLADPDPRRRALAVAAWVRRLYSPRVADDASSSPSPSGVAQRIGFSDGSAVLVAVAEAPELGKAAERLLDSARAEPESAHAIELFAPVAGQGDLAVCERALENVHIEGDGLPALTFTAVAPDGAVWHRSFEVSPEGLRPQRSLHGIHPETARRIDLARLAKFELERLPGAENIYCFHGRAHAEKADERLFVLADAHVRSPDDGSEASLHAPAFEHAFYEATRALRSVLRTRDPKRRLQWNRIALYVTPPVSLDPGLAQTLARRLAPATRHLGLEKVVVRISALDAEAPDRVPEPVEFAISDLTGSNMEIHTRPPHRAPLEPRSDYERRVAVARRHGLLYPYEIVRMLTGEGRGAAPGTAGADLPPGTFEEFDLDPAAETPRAVSVGGRPYGGNTSAVVFGVVTTPTEKVPEGMRRVLVLSDPTFGMGALAGPECDRVFAALELARERGLPVEWLPVSAGARIAMDSGTENLDATARVVRRIVRFTQGGGVINVIVTGVNVGAQSYWNALSTMLSHTKGALIMTPRASMVLTGRAALDASGAVSAEDEPAIGGYERVMGPNGEAQYFATDLADAYRILYEHHRFTYVVPGEPGPRRFSTGDPASRGVSDAPCEGDEGFDSVGQIFDAGANPGRKRPFPMRSVMGAVVDRDGGHLERWAGWVGAETAIVWDAHIGGRPVCFVGIESRAVEREGYRPLDGPASWTPGTLFPLSSKKVSRAINAASGNRPVVVFANLSGFDGSPESMRKLQLEYGAEIARAVVNFDGPIVFLVVSRYHGGAYVVFSQELNPRLKAAALEGSYASVIGGGPAAAVVFDREARARALADPDVAALDRAARGGGSLRARERFERVLSEAVLDKQAEVAAEFDAIHTVERARKVGSLSEIVAPDEMRAFLVHELSREGPGEG